MFSLSHSARSNNRSEEKKGQLNVLSKLWMSLVGEPSEDAKVINGSSVKVVITHSGVRADTYSLLTNGELTKQASYLREASGQVKDSD